MTDAILEELEGYERVTFPGMMRWHFAPKKTNGHYKTLCGLEIMNKSVAYRKEACSVCQARARAIREGTTR